MKNLVKKVSSVIVIALFIMGCSKDDEVDAVVVTPPTNAELIIGTWKWTGSTDMTLNECELKTTIIFDGMLFNTSYFVTYEARCIVDSMTSDNYSINENIVYIKRELLDNYDFEIIELNATTLKIKFKSSTQNVEIFHTYTKSK